MGRNDTLRWMAVARTAVFALIFMGTFGVYLPRYLGLLSGGLHQDWRLAGIVPLVLGTLIALRCAFAFAWTGLGTPAPFDPPRALVATGALLGSFAALLLFFEALRHDSLSVSTVIRSAGPVATAACAWPFFPVALTPLNVVGGAVLLGSVAWLSLGPGRPRSRA